MAIQTKRITCVEDVIRALVVDKGMTVWEAIREYESSYGRLSDTIAYNIIWENDHKWSKEIK